MAIPNFPELEQKILQDWKEQDIFGQTLRKPAPRGRFVFFDGPPTANGMPHIGHVETRVFKDLIPRFKTMQGFSVDRKAGWDTQGLPVEIEVEKLLGISGKKGIEAFGVEKFNAQARESVWKYKGLWEQMTERIGFWLDVDHPYITYSNDYIESLWWIFKQAWDLKLLEQDFKVIPYCPRCGTALSSHEVAQGYQLVKEPSVYIKFELVDEPGTFVLAWTTTPWTLPGNVALAVDQDFDYVKVQAADGTKLILAKALLHKLKSEDQTIVETMKGKELVGKSYRPLFDFIDLTKTTGKKAYYIADADFVTTEDGTGVVHTAVMYGIEDFDLGKKLDLPTVHTVDEQGKFNELVTPWVGREVKDAEGKTQQLVIDWLRDHGQLYRLEEYEHDYPFCWRCKHALLYYAKTTWFIRMTALQKELQANNEQINWYPRHIQHGRFGEWLREVKDWAISRERYWGTPLPIWTCADCGKQECIGSYAELALRLPTRNKYFFIRHAESIINTKGVLNTVLENKDIAPLSEKGSLQAKQAAKDLHDKQVDVIFSSPFRRAKETADIIASEKGMAVTVDERLREFLVGPVFEGKTLAEYHAAFPTSDRQMRLTTSAVGGETWLDMRTRLFAFMREIDARFEGKSIVVVTHGDPVLMMKWAAELRPVAQIDEIEYPSHASPHEIRFVADLFRADGSFDPHRPFLDDLVLTCDCGGSMKRVPEVADTWFDSGSMPFAQWHYPFENKAAIDDGTAYPADFISEAIDQTRGWFYTLLAVSTILQKAGVVKEPPFKNVVVLGHVLDAKGKKLSKSDKNYIDPMTVIDQYGADAVRWFLYTANQPWDSKNFDPKIVEEGIRKTFLIWMNVVSFWELYTQESAVAAPVSEHILDRWIRAAEAKTVQRTTELLEQYDITTAARGIGEFITELSTWYVRRSRDRMKGADVATVSAQLRRTLLTVSKLMAPFTPFLAEAMYRRVGGPTASVHLEDWPSAEAVDEDLIADMQEAREVVEEVLALRAKAGIKVRQPLRQLVTKHTVAESLHEIVCDELNVKEIHARATALPNGEEWVTSEQSALDISLDDELREEGYYRDLVREVNALRKKAGLTPSDQIIVYCPAQTTAAKIIERFATKFLDDVRARAATPSLDGATLTTDIDLDGSVTIGLSKV